MRTAVIGIVIAIGLCSGCATNKSSPQRNVFPVDASAKEGAFLGNYKSGETIVIAYIDGKWSVSPNYPLLSPDDDIPESQRFQSYYKCGLHAKTAAGQFQLLSLIPANTKERPFRYEFQFDCEAFLINRDPAGYKFDNYGVVNYRVSRE